MHRVILAISIAFVFASSSYSQDTIDYATANSKTLQFTNSAQWDSVIYYGNRAVADSIDYFYLRQRMGIAYYSKEYYFDAICQFKKAMQFNSSDVSTMEYLYYCYILTNRENERKLLESEMNENVKKSLNIEDKAKFINSLYVEGGNVIANNIERNKNINVNQEYEFYGEADLSDNISYLNAGMSHRISKHITLYHGLQVLRMDKLKIMSAYNDFPGDKNTNISYDSTYYAIPPPAHYIYDTTYVISQTIDKTHHSDTISSNLKQLEYYINLNFHTKAGWDIAPFFHYVNVTNSSRFVKPIKTLFTSTDSIILHTQVWLPGSGGPDIVDTVIVSTNTHADTLYTYNFPEDKLVLSNFAAGISFSKYFGRLHAEFFGSYSNLNSMDQIQVGADVIYFPKSNLDLYLEGALTFWNQEKENRIIGHVLMGFKLAKKAWIECSSYLGRMSNYTSKDGFLVYNNNDPIIISAGIKPIFVFKHFDISVAYNYLKKKGHYITYTSESNYTTSSFNYSAHSITGGVKWKI